MEQLQALQDNVDRLRESINNGTGMEVMRNLIKSFISFWQKLQITMC